MRFLLSAAAVLLVLAGAARAQEAGWVSADYVQARLAGGGVHEAQAQTYLAAVDIRLSAGWHAYWRMPGEGGLPPRFDWQGSENVKDVEILWPAPARFETYGLYSFGYKDAVLLPLQVRLTDPQKPATVRAAAEIMVCNEVCVPQKLTLSLTFDAMKAGADRARIETALARVPHKGDTPQLRIDSAVAGAKAVVVNAFSQNGFEGADLFVESGDIYVTASPVITIDEKDPRRAMITVAAPADFDGFAGYVMGRPLTLTLVAGGRAVEKTINF